MEDTKNFQLIGPFNLETLSDNHVQQTLITMSNQVVKTLHTLFLRKAIATEQYEKMMYYNQTTICNFNHLYFIPEMRNKKEVIGRHLNQILFTWNDSKDELYTLLKRVNLFHPRHIQTQITTSIDNKIEYLGVEICHYEGQLQTRVYHNVDYEPYALPYQLETTTATIPEDYDLLLDAALVQVMFFCSNVDEFENERLYIEVSFIINGAPMNIIREAVQNFFVEFHLFMEDNTCIHEITYQNRLQFLRNIPPKVNKYTLEARGQE
ncbi:unnamed protein product [Rotaria sp. Silwood2]|nr:unnamed protein product [Rotaria sp. Silwood2]CAF2784841.1 unnamed protein product [Rotaria sp. Silwood2]CAF3253301.1 unnamed protein product [Rotaria sp. Silwood2]CAF4134394.1 unnamed protein product [Rotaria sp. Silwood2]CAF4135689.1 unnamed protein product [Rotaria sp. Silwood2]